MMIWRKFILVAVALFCQFPSHIALARIAMPALALDLNASLKLQDGRVRIDSEQFTIRLNEDYRFINAKDTTRILIEAWGNPPEQVAEQNPLGMIVPKEFVRQGALWGVVITATHDGHVDDKDGRKINFDSIMTMMREDAKSSNKQRKAMGAEPITSIDWATEPRFDPLAHKLYWAKEIGFGSKGVRTLNYAVRILGREATIHLNAVGSMDRFESISQAMQTVLAFSEFDEGYRYQDFNPKYHRLANYGLTGLITGQVASKLGFFNGLWAFVFGSKKLFLASLSGLAVALGRWLGRNKQPEF